MYTSGSELLVPLCVDAFQTLHLSTIHSLYRLLGNHIQATHRRQTGQLSIAKPFLLLAPDPKHLNCRLENALPPALVGAGRLGALMTCPCVCRGIGKLRA